MATSTRPRRDQHGREPKTERMELRLAPLAKQIIQRAMSVTGSRPATSPTKVRGASWPSIEHMVLSGVDRDAVPRCAAQPAGAY